MTAPQEGKRSVDCGFPTSPELIAIAADADVATRVRFWSRVKQGGADECWEWQGRTDSKGYGGFDAGGRGHRAHRFAYISLRGPIDPTLTLDHLCRNPACVNPLHLEPVTSRRNTLRGESPVAENARRTHCRRGHPYAGHNLVVWKNKRYCRKCMTRYKRDHMRRARRADATCKRCGEALGETAHICAAHPTNCNCGACGAPVPRPASTRSARDGRKVRSERVEAGVDCPVIDDRRGGDLDMGRELVDETPVTPDREQGCIPIGPRLPGPDIISVRCYPCGSGYDAPAHEVRSGECRCPECGKGGTRSRYGYLPPDTMRITW